MTEAEVRGLSFGRVHRRWSKGNSSWSALAGTLFDPKIFGPRRDFACECGLYNAEAFAGSICHRCGVKVGLSRSMARRRFGHIQLPRSIQHPLCSQSSLSVIPVLPIAFRRRSGQGPDLNCLYDRLLRACGECDVSLEEATAQLFANDYLPSPFERDRNIVRSIMFLLLDSPERSIAQAGRLLAGMALRVGSSAITRPII